MSKITLIGDAHGKVNALTQLYATLETSSIQLGDMGCGFRDIPEFSEQHKFIRGNHDDPAIAKAHPNYLWDYGYLHEYGIFYIGGAYSVDFEYRQFMMSQGGKPVWWADEELSSSELYRVISYYEEVQPHIVISHEAPQSAGVELLKITEQRAYKYSSTQSRTARAMQSMLEIHAPKLWVFGHYHMSNQFSLDKTKFVCLNELKTIEIDTESV